MADFDALLQQTLNDYRDVLVEQVKNMRPFGWTAADEADMQARLAARAAWEAAHPHRAKLRKRRARLADWWGNHVVQAWGVLRHGHDCGDSW